MELDYLRTFIDLAETGSFSKAAELSGITQPGASWRIRTLENRLGYRLVKQEGLLVSPTSAGSLLIEMGRKILKVQNEIRYQLDHLKPRKNFSFGCTPAFWNAHLPSLLRALHPYKASHLNFRFESGVASQILAGVHANHFDVAIIEHCADQPLDDFDCVPLADDHLFFISSPTPGLPPLVDFRELKNFNYIGSDQGDCDRMLLCNNLKNFGVDCGYFKNVTTFNDINFVIDAVLNHEGVTFISESVVRQLASSGQIQMFRVKGFVQTRKRTLFVNKKYSDVDFLSWFENLILTLPFCEGG